MRMNPEILAPLNNSFFKSKCKRILKFIFKQIHYLSYLAFRRDFMTKNINQKKIVLKMGGSLLFNDDLSIKLKYLLKLQDILKNSTNIKAIIIGGGIIARKYIQAGRHFNADESMSDTFGINVSRINAQLMQVILGERAYPKLITNLEEARFATLYDRILLAGGFIPGQSTTSVTFEIAEAINATDVIILTDVDGIYNKDPHLHPDAIKYDQLTITQLEEVIYGEGGTSQSAAGEYRIFDAVSMQIFKRSSINVRLLNGTNFSELRALFIEQKYDASMGTKILH